MIRDDIHVGMVVFVTMGHKIRTKAAVVIKPVGSFAVRVWLLTEKRRLTVMCSDLGYAKVEELTPPALEALVLYRLGLDA